MASDSLIDAHLDHRRTFDDFLYVYPVISRRSKGVSIGVNLNPDKVCNFDCVYCEVDRKVPGRVRAVDLPVLETELRAMIGAWKDGTIFQREPFASAPMDWRRLNDIAFSGDGEPTTCPVFDGAVEIAFRLRGELTTPETKLVLITDSACLDRPKVKAGLDRMRQGAHEVWAKLDAGTESYYRTVNRSNISFDRVLKNITETAQRMPIWIQTLFLKVHGELPSEAEITAYNERIREVLKAGGQIIGLQLYTVARPTPEAFACALTTAELDAIAGRIHEATGLPQVLGYGNAN